MSKTSFLAHVSSLQEAECDGETVTIVSCAGDGPLALSWAVGSGSEPALGAVVRVDVEVSE